MLERDGARALEYISMGWDRNEQKLFYLPSGIEHVFGHTGLRAELAKWLNGKSGRGDLTSSNFILTSGSVQAIALGINGLVNPGDGVLVESATFPYAMRFAESRRAVLRAVDLDHEGLDPKSLRMRLEEMRTEGIRPKLLYIIATFQLPTGVVTTTDRRIQILELANEFDFLILEDNIYGDLRYSGAPIPSLMSLDQANRVMQSNGFSKTVAPALRLGWMAGPEKLIGALGAVRQDLGVSLWTSLVMERFVSEGLWDKHIDMVNEVYRRKRDVAVQALRDFCSPWVTFDVPDGGFYLWLKMESDLDWQYVRSAAEAAGVMFRFGERFMSRDAVEAGEGGRYIRLAFSHVGDDELRRGIQVIGTSLQSAAALHGLPRRSM